MGDRVLKLLVVLGALAGAAAPATTMAAASPAEPLGRLFFTPAQRASLDIARSRRARATLSTENTEEVAAPVPQTITYGGMVRRSDGKTTVWINSRPVNDKESAGAAIVGRVRPDGSVSLQVPQSGRSVDLKPGQSIELLSGAIEESYSGKPVTPLEPKPAAKPSPDAKAAKPAAEAKPAVKPASAERVAEERNREEREQQRVEEAVSRALQEAAGTKPSAAPAQTPKGPAP